MKREADTPKVREAVGVFNDAPSLRQAIDRLLESGRKRTELGLLASEKTVEDRLGDLYARTGTSHDVAETPAIAFVERDSIGETGTSLGGGLFFVGASGVMGGVVASSAVLGGALMAALGGAVAVGVIGALVASVIHQSDAEFLQQQIDEGRILLFVRILDPSNEHDIVQTLAHYSGADAKVYDVPVNRQDGGLTQASR